MPLWSAERRSPQLSTSTHMKLNDAIIGLLLLAVGLAVLIGVQDYPNIPGQDVGPDLFPALIATGLLIGGAMLLVRG